MDYFKFSAPKRRAEDEIDEQQPALPARRRVEEPTCLTELHPANMKSLGAWNSSGQRPKRNAAHNDDIAANYPRGHLLNMPLFVQRRIFAKVLRHDDPLTIDPTKGPAAGEKNDLALLEVCRSIRKEAVPIYYVVNSFELKIKNFNASVLLKWWARATMHRKNATALPILLAGGSVDMTPTWVQHGVPEILKQTIKDGNEVLLHRLELFKDFSTTPQAPRGDIKLSVEYSPNCANLQEWLYLSHNGELPILQVSDVLSSDLRMKDKLFLRGVVETSKIIEGYKGLPWETAEKSLAGVRGFLARDDVSWYDEPAVEQPTEDEEVPMDIDNSSDISSENTGAAPGHDPLDSESEDQEFHINAAGNLESLHAPTQTLGRSPIHSSAHSASPIDPAATQYFDSLSQLIPTQTKKQDMDETDDEAEDDEDEEIAEVREPTWLEKATAGHKAFASPAQEAQSRIKKGRMHWPRK